MKLNRDYLTNMKRRIEYMRLDEFLSHFHPDNPKAHNLPQIEASIATLGFKESPLIDESTGYVVAGHGRALALWAHKQAGKPMPTGLEEAQDGMWMIPVERGVAFNDEDEVRAYLIASNQLTTSGGWDIPKLEGIMLELQDTPLFNLTGFTADLLGEMGIQLGGAPAPLPEAPDAQIDRAAELNQKWGVQRGDLWQIGTHRLLCGDSSNKEDILKIVDNQKVTYIFSDPPYGINIVAANGYVGGGEAYNIPFGGVKNKGLGSVGGAKPFGSKNDNTRILGTVGAKNIVDTGKYAPIAGDNSIDVAINTSTLYLEMYPDAVHIWWGGNYYAHVLPPSPCWIVWNKDNTGNFADCELAWTNQPTAVRMFTHRWNGMLRDSEHNRRWHPTQKPSALAVWCFDKYGCDGDIILDPFAGAGCSMVGSEQIGNRVNLSIELSPDYCAVILERMSEMGLNPEKVPINPSP